MPTRRKTEGPKKPRATKAAPEVEGRPVTTGDMQEVGATSEEEARERRRTTDGAEPVHENPGDQNSG